MMEITAEIRALIDKAAAGVELAGDEYIDRQTASFTAKSAAARGRPLCHALGNRATSCPAASASASGRPRNSAKAAEERPAPHGAYQAPEGPGPARPLSVRLHLSNDNGQNPLMDKARAYVENWKEAYKNNTGLLLFGDVGTGKSFFAGCIANALLDRDVPVLMDELSHHPEPPDRDVRPGQGRLYRQL